MQNISPLTQEALAHEQLISPVKAEHQKEFNLAFASFTSVQGRRTPAAVLILYTMLAYSAFSSTPLHFLLPWYVIASTYICVRAWLLWRLPSQQHLNAEKKIQRISRLSFWNGIIAGSYFLFVPYLSESQRFFAILAFVGCCTAALGMTMGHPRVFGRYLWPVTISIFLSLNLLNDVWVERGLSLVVVFYAWVLHALAKDFFRIYSESHDLRYRENSLNHQLTLSLARVEEANAAKTLFLASASHDLRQPMHTISLLIATLSLRKLDTRSQEIVSLLEAANKGLSTLLDSLLDISKLDANLVQVQNSLFSLNELLAECVALNRFRLEEKGLRCEEVYQAKLMLYADRLLLMRIIQNVLDNAIKFTRTGSIRVTLQQSNAQAIFAIQDSGIGIPKNLQSKVFQEFFQIGNPERDRSKGIGLGLSIVERLVKITHGEMSLHSTHMGTRFEFKYPIAEVDASDAYPLPNPQGADISRIKGMKVLVIDDEKMVRTSLGFLLEELGCVVRLADSTQQALAVATEWQPDMLLADYRLTGDDSGTKAIQALWERYPKLPAAFISGDTAPDRLLDASRVGVPFLHKPLQRAQLIEVLQSAHRSHSNGET